MRHDAGVDAGPRQFAVATARAGSAFALAWVLLELPVALACSCETGPEARKAPAAELGRRSLVVVASVVDVELKTGCSRSDRRRVATMNVEEAFVGADVGDSIEVVTFLDSCREKLAVGQQWLLFTSVEGPRVDYCGRSTVLGEGWSFVYCAPREDGDTGEAGECGEGFVEVALTEEEVLGEFREAAGMW